MLRARAASAIVRSSPYIMDIQTPDFQKYLLTLLLTLHEISYPIRTFYFRSINILPDEIGQ